MKKYSWLEIIGDALIIAFGIITIYIFFIIQIQGSYGIEANRFLRWVELIMGIPMIALGINRLIQDAKK